VEEAPVEWTAKGGWKSSP